MKTEIENQALEKLKSLDEPKFKYGIGINFHVNLDENQKSKDSINITSNKKVKIKNIQEFTDTEFSIINSNLSIENKIDALHYSDLSNTKLIELEDQECKIEINETENSNSHLIIIAKKGTENKIELISKSKNNQFIESIILVLQENSKVNFTYVTEHDNTNYFSNKIFEVYKNANLIYNDIILRSNQNKSKIVAKLMEENAKSEINTINFSKLNEKSDIEVISHHKSKDSESKINSKIILDGKSKAIYRSNIIVDKKCSNSKGHQLAKVLLLSKESKIDAVPMLEVENEKVEISHGVSISDIDKEELFYLQSRGLEKEVSRSIIINGFIETELNKLSEQSRQEIEKRLESEDFNQVTTKNE